MPAFSYKEPLRLAEHLDSTGAVGKAGVRALTDFVAAAVEVAEDKGCAQMVGFATSAVPDAASSAAVVGRGGDGAGGDVEVVRGEGEARLTFLGVRGWFGWSPGRLAVFD